MHCKRLWAAALLLLLPAMALAQRPQQTRATGTPAVRAASATRPLLSEIPDGPDQGSPHVDTGRESPFMTAREKRMLREVNLVRTDPQGYIPFIEEHIRRTREIMEAETQPRRYVKDIKYKNRVKGSRVETVADTVWATAPARLSNQYSVTAFSTYDAQGKETVAYDTLWAADMYRDEIESSLELIEELRNMQPLPALQPDFGVYNAARSHGMDQRRRGFCSHQGSDGSWPWDRIRRHAPHMAGGNENLAGGPATIRQIVINLLVDSGIPSRGHRRNMLNPQWTHAACYEVGTVAGIQHEWVQEFARPRPN